MTTLDQPAPGTYRLSRTRLDRVAEALRASANQTLAIRHARISAPTYRRWRDTGYEDLNRWIEQRNLDPADFDIDAFLQQVPFEDQPFIHFVLTIEKALSDFELENLAAINTAGIPRQVTETITVEAVDPDGKTTRTTTTKTKPVQYWQASAWLLERRLPDAYARTIRQEITGPAGGPVPLDPNAGAAARLEAKLQQMRERADAADRLVIDIEARELNEG